MLNLCDLKITLLYYSILTLVQIQCMPTWNRSWNTCSHVLLNCIIISSPCGQEKFYFSHIDNRREIWYALMDALVAVVITNSIIFFFVL